MTKILVDTSIIIDYFRSMNKTITLFSQVFTQPNNFPCISQITITELWAGKSTLKPEVDNYISSLIKNMEILPINDEIAKQTGIMIRNQNYTISFQDAYIAVTSIFNKLPLLTLNTKDFEKVEGIRLYSLV